MKHFVSIQKEFLKFASSKPSFFCCTKYRDPTDEELVEINNANLSPEEVNKGLGYSIVGRGMEWEEQKT